MHAKQIALALTLGLIAALALGNNLTQTADPEADNPGDGRTVQKVAVLPFTNKAPAELEAFVNGISTMLTINLTDSEKLRVIEASAIDKVLAKMHPSLREQPLMPDKPQASRELGKRLGVDLLITGSFAEDDGGYRLEGHVFDVKTGKQVIRLFKRGSRTQSIGLVSELTSALLEKLTSVDRVPKKVAILYFRNLISKEYDAFVATMPAMLQMSLGKLQGVALVERAKIQQCLKPLKLAASGVPDVDQVMQLGPELGADALVIGSFTMSRGIYQLSAVLIDGRTGKRLTLGGKDELLVKGDETQLMTLPNDLGEKLKEIWEKERISDILTMGNLEVRFQLTRSAMTERPVYFHICKLYVDGEFKQETSVVALDQWVKLYSGPLRAGEHELEVLHGYAVKKEGEWVWKDRFRAQPRKFDIAISRAATTEIRYAYKVGMFKDEYEYREK